MNMPFGSLAYILLLTFMVCSGKSLNFHSNDGLKHKYGKKKHQREFQKKNKKGLSERVLVKLYLYAK